MPDIADVAWSEREDRNTEPVPNGWPTGAFPAFIDQVGQMMMAAIKRSYNKANPVYETQGTGDAYTVALEGDTTTINLFEIIRVRADRSNVGTTPTLQYGSTSPRTMVKYGPSGTIPLAAGDIYAGTECSFYYDGANYVLTNPAIIIGGNVQPYSPNLTSWAAIARATGFDTFVASPTSANLAALVGDETGTGKLVFNTGPTLLAPAFSGSTSGSTVLQATATASGTLTLPAATDTLVGRSTTDTLTNKTISGTSNTITNVPISTGISGLGTGVATALGVSVGTSGAFVVNGGALGTPASGVATNITGMLGTNVINTPAGNITSTNVQAALNELDTKKIGGTTGTADKALIRANGTGGQTEQSSTSYLSDSGVLRLGSTSAPDAEVSGVHIGPTAAATTGIGYLAAQSITSFKSGGYHPFSDNSTYNEPSGNTAAASFDALPSTTGTANYDHLAGFQSRSSFGSSGTLSDMYGHVDLPTVTAGTVTNRHGVSVWDVGKSGSGAVTTNYGVHIKALLAGGTNWAIYTEGATASHFGGAVEVGAALTPVTDNGSALGTTTKEWSGLFLASGGVINFANGNVTATHSSGVLTVGGGQIVNTLSVWSASSLAPTTAGQATAYLGSGAVGIYLSSGVPTVSAAKGSLCINTAATTATTRLYINTNGSTGWAAISAAS